MIGILWVIHLQKIAYRVSFDAFLPCEVSGSMLCTYRKKKAFRLHFHNNTRTAQCPHVISLQQHPLHCCLFLTRLPAHIVLHLRSPFLHEPNEESIQRLLLNAPAQSLQIFSLPRQPSSNLNGEKRRVQEHDASLVPCLNQRGELRVHALDVGEVAYFLLNDGAIVTSHL